MMHHSANLDMVEHVPGPLHWAVRWRRWRDGTPHGGWAGLATIAFWNAWRNGHAALRAVGINARKDHNQRWWVTWQGGNANGPARPERGQSGIEPLATLLHKAVDGVCDNDPDTARERNGVGFNRTDTATGHGLASVPPDEWTMIDVMRAWRMMRKYHRQIPRALYARIYGRSPEHAGGESRQAA